jgi:hypothetical protein
MSPQTFPTDSEVVQAITDVVIRRFADANGSGKAEIKPLRFHDFSICFSLRTKGDRVGGGYFVKIGKSDRRLRKARSIFPLTDADRRLAEDEYASLLYLHKFWNNADIDVNFVEPVGFLREYSALIARHIEASDFFRTFRRWDLLGRFSRKENQNKEALHVFFFRLGAALAHFHGTHSKMKIFCVKPIIAKIERYVTDLSAGGADDSFCRSVLKRLCAHRDFTVSTIYTFTLKGLDIRNILMDRTGRLHLLDPGRMKEDCREADLARFLVTCRILYWGSFLFFLRLAPGRAYEKGFLEGYSGSGETCAGTEDTSPMILSLLSIKELFKHWHMAHVALRLKNWPAPFKPFLRRCYIDPFYRQHISAELNRLEA